MFNKHKDYPAIDLFRLIAAFLIVAIHTDPLEGVTDVGNLLLTRVIARIAVPFFFVTSGFFLISRYAKARRLADFEKKTGLIYAACVLLCLPLTLYSGGWKGISLPGLIGDLVFDGTLYHLWYLPAAMLGGAIAFGLLKKLGYKGAFAASGALYAVGLLGDSYYGLAVKIPGVERFYGFLFGLFDYTRNGLFFAPLFFLLGGWLADRLADREARLSVGQGREGQSAGTDKPEKVSGAPDKSGETGESILTEKPGAPDRSGEIGAGVPRFSGIPGAAACWIAFALCMIGMAVEAMLLHRFDLPRHDSMYLLLPAAAFFLTAALAGIRGRRMRRLRDASLLIYILHPIVIAGIHLIGGRSALLWVALEGFAPVRYLAVCALSAAISFAAVALWDKIAPKRPKHRPDSRAYVEISRENLLHNVRVLSDALPGGCALMAVVKTHAYGHGAREVAVELDRAGVPAFAVATLEEGVELRKAGIRGEILILGYSDPAEARKLRRYRLTQTLIDADYARRLNSTGVRVQAHLKIDSGMHRLGINSADLESVKATFALKNLQITGIYTHLCCSDGDAPDDRAFTLEQIARFDALLAALRAEGVKIPKIHVQSSYGLLNYPDLRCDYVRAGVALYGVKSLPGDPCALNLDLRPVLTLKSRVILIRSVKAGESVGYGRRYVAARDGKIAILPIGYGDGYPRALSEGVGRALIRGKLLPIAGRICMDQLAVDVTDAPEVSVGDEAALINGTVSGLSAAEVAEAAGTISNELLCRLGSRLEWIVTK